MKLRFFALPLLVSLVAVPAWAADLLGKITDKTGGVLPGATVRLLNIATGDATSAVADTGGAYKFTSLQPGLYRLAASRPGFSDASRTVVLGEESQTVDFVLEIGALRAETTALAARGGRDVATVPLRADPFTGDMIRAIVPASTGDALVSAPGVTPVGSGPFQIRPRLRGLDSTRVLVLVDGERLNNARTATDRAGIEVGLIDPDSIDGVEVLGGAGSVLYGTDALAGTINIVTNRPQLTPERRLTLGFDGFYSSNENGRRGTATIGYSGPRAAIRFMGGAERFDDYKAGGDFAETSLPFFTSGRLVQADTIDTNFPPFAFHAFPDPFNAPFTRTSNVIPTSGMEGSSINVAGRVQLAAAQHLEVKFQRRRATDVGFPDFAEPFFFQRITLPFSNLDKFSASYTATNVARWLPRLTATTYYQRQDRLLRNVLPVQFPAPTATTFFPINVFRLDIQSDTRQQVWTPGLDVQATLLTRPDNVLTAGVSVFRDRSEDERTTSTQMSLLGFVGLGAFGPAPTVFDMPTPLGPPSIAHPVRVPDASFRDLGFFVHDEWAVSPVLRVTAGLRLDNYRVVTDPTPGYDIASFTAGASPAIDPSTLPDVNGDRISRHAFTGEAGVVAWADRPVSLFAHYVRSYRHPNLEELLFSGPATAGNIVPNVTVKPETGHNVDVGTRVRLARVSGSLSYFSDAYDDFISTEIVSNGDAGSISQAINLARVRIQGVEAQADAPVVAGGLVWAPSASVAYTRGTVLEGTSPLSGLSLAGAPQDNITPWKISLGLRVSDRAGKWWAGYSMRAQTDVTRVSPLLSDSPFLIAQDLLALDGFTLHRIAGGYDWRRGGDRLGVTIAVDNLSDVFYREHFQFAPARGRSVSIAVHVGGVR
jgi:outer membrane receptor protein involved in Fe transport